MNLLSAIKRPPIRYRVRPLSDMRWSPWRVAKTVTQGLGWIEFDGQRYDSSWAWEAEQDLDPLRHTDF